MRLKRIFRSHKIQKISLIAANGLFFGLLFNTSFAATNQIDTTPHEASVFHSVFSLSGGAAYFNAHHSQTFQGTDGDLFHYQSKEKNQLAGFIGAFVGVEYPLAHNGLFLQTGFEYVDFGNIQINGSNLIGIEPATYTLYSYHYHMQTQQTLAVAKLFTTTTLPRIPHHPIYPYVSLGLGASFNRSSEFNISTQESGSVNLAPTFRNNTNTAFSYQLGVGVETRMSRHVQIGVGYQFSSFGKAALGGGQIALNQYIYPTSFIPNITNIYANQFVAQISYRT